MSARIAVVRDLIVDSRRDDPNYLFYLAYTLAVDHDGNIYVLDRGNHRVQVFDKTGNHILTIGRDGQGPGELAAPLSIAIAGDHVVVSDVGTHRVTRWTLRGEYVDDSHVVFETGLSRIVGLADGSFVGSYKASRVSAEDVSYISISRFGADLIESIKYAELPFRVVRALVGNRRL
ncbi:MAG: 6-bladed beta-propeller, partial [Acidobacteriota bacterium]